MGKLIALLFRFHEILKFPRISKLIVLTISVTEKEILQKRNELINQYLGGARQYNEFIDV
jgi:hypothetical protein